MSINHSGQREIERERERQLERVSERELVHRRAQLGNNLANSAESTASRQAYLHLAKLLRQLVVVAAAATDVAEREGQQLSNMKIVAHESGKAAACHRHTAPVCQSQSQSLLFILLRLELYACPRPYPCPRLGQAYCFGTATTTAIEPGFVLVLHNSRNFSGGTACSGADTLLPGPPNRL